MNGGYPMQIQVASGQGSRPIHQEARQFVAFHARGKFAQCASSILAQNYYDYRQYIAYNKANGSLYVDPEIYNGKIVNLCKWAVDIAHTEVSRERYIPEAYVTADSAEAERRAEVATLVLQDIHERNGGYAGDSDLMLRLMNSGDKFLRPEIDPHALDFLLLTPDELEAYVRMTGKQPIDVEEAGNGRLQAMFRMGHVVHRIIDGNNVILPHGQSSFADCDRFAIVHYLPVERIQAIAQQLAGGEDPELVKSVYIEDILAPPMQDMTGSFGNSQGDASQWQDATGARTYTQDSGMGQCMEYWRRDVLGSGDWTCHYFANMDWSLYLGESGPHMKHLLTHFKCRHRGQRTTPFGTNMISGMAGHQTTVNKSATQIIECVRNGMKETVFVPQGTALNSFSDAQYTVVTYTGRHDANAIKVVTMPPQTMTVMQDLLRTYEGFFLREARVSEIQQGNVPERMSEALYEEIRRGNRDTLADMVDRFQASMKEVWTNDLFIVQQSGIFGLPRLRTKLGDRGELMAREFVGAGVSLACQIRVKQGVPRPQSSDDRRSFAKELARDVPGIFQPDAMGDAIRKGFGDFIDSGDIRSVRSRVERLNRRNALEENDRIVRLQVTIRSDYGVQGQPGSAILTQAPQQVVDARTMIPLFHAIQMHDIHMEIHNEKLAELDAGTREFDFMLLHLQEHQQHMDQVEADAREEALKQTTDESMAEFSPQLVAAGMAAQSQQEAAAAKAKQNPKQAGKKGPPARDLKK